MNFPTLTAPVSATFSQEEALHWRMGIPFDPPAGAPRPWGAFAENIARRHLLEIAELEFGLERAFFADISEERPPRARERIIAALELIFLYLSKNNIAAFLLTELLQIVSALKDLDRGVPHPSFERKRIPRRPPLKSQIWEAKAYVAVAVELMIAGGLLKKDALQNLQKNFSFLADSLSPAERISEKSSDFGKLVGKWHQELVSGISGDPPAQAFFDDRQRYIDFLKRSLGTVEPNLLAQEVLMHATQLAARSSDAAAIARTAARFRRRTPARTARSAEKK